MFVSIVSKFRLKYQFVCVRLIALGGWCFDELDLKFVFGNAGPDKIHSFDNFFDEIIIQNFPLH